MTRQNLKCKACGSRRTSVTTAGKLANLTGDDSVLSSTAGVISPDTVMRLIAAVAGAFRAGFDYFTESKKHKRKVVVCEACGHWERV